jgi:hypothetical protein
MKLRRDIAHERIGITLFALVYLILFNRVLPHGDALRIVRQIEASDLIWNPNHLLFDPLGYGFYRLVERLRIPLDALTSFELLSGVSTIISLVLFHAVLCRAGVAHRGVRLVATAALFGSSSFIFVAVSQYYFMVQMPFLIGALYFYMDFLRSIGNEDSRRSAASLYAIGILLALATSLMFNNLLLLILTGLAVGTAHGWKNFQWTNSLRVFAAAGAVGLPIFLLGHALADTESDLFTWVLSYEGDASSGLNEYYGARWTATRIAQGLAMVGFNYALGDTVETAGLGTVLSVLVFGGQFEFNPQWSKILLSLLVSLPVVVMHLAIIWYLLRNVPRQRAVRLVASWIAAYLLFNFLWNVSDETFWVQVLPATWLAFLMMLRATPHIQSNPGAVSLIEPQSWRYKAFATLAILLFIVNTANAIVPLSWSSFSENQQQHAAMLRPGDLEIVPGWDQQKWMAVDDRGTTRKLMLMNMALPGASPNIAALPSIIDKQLRSNGRVIVARLYDKDDDMMPWYSLADLGWPRAKIQSLLAGYCTQPLQVIDDVVFRELKACDKNDDAE